MGTSSGGSSRSGPSAGEGQTPEVDARLLQTPEPGGTLRGETEGRDGWGGLDEAHQAAQELLDPAGEDNGGDREARPEAPDSEGEPEEPTGSESDPGPSAIAACGSCRSCAPICCSPLR